MKPINLMYTLLFCITPQLHPMTFDVDTQELASTFCPDLDFLKEVNTYIKESEKKYDAIINALINAQKFLKNESLSKKNTHFNKKGAEKKGGLKKES